MRLLQGFLDDAWWLGPWSDAAASPAYIFQGSNFSGTFIFGCEAEGVPGGAPTWSRQGVGGAISAQRSLKMLAALMLPYRARSSSGLSRCPFRWNGLPPGRLS